jgi:hypothetical protein
VRLGNARGFRLDALLDWAIDLPWFFETLGFEHVIGGGSKSGAQVGLFGEATLIDIPPSMRGFYGVADAVTINVGVHVFGMWMLDGDLNRMHHAM